MPDIGALVDKGTTKNDGKKWESLLPRLGEMKNWDRE